MSADKSQAAASRRKSWVTRYTVLSSKDRDSHSSLTSPPEGKVVTDYAHAPSTHSPAAGGLPFARSNSSSALSSSHISAYNADRPSLPSRRSSTNSLMSKQQLDEEASKIIIGALGRSSNTSPPEPPQPSRSSVSSFSRKSLTSMIGGLSSLSLSRSSTADEKERGRSRTQQDYKIRSSSVVSSKSVDDADQSGPPRTRSTSPFFRNRRKRHTHDRDASPTFEALKSQSDAESDFEEASRSSFRPRNAFSQSALSDDDSGEDVGDEDDSEVSWSDNDHFDSITEQNTEQNALIPAVAPEADSMDAPDPLGEGVNIVIPPEPYFPTTLNTRRTNPRRKKSTRHVALPLVTSRPAFARDRCTITLVQGDPAHALELNGRRSRKYIVGSDLSEESRYALEWGIGTVLRDGDEMMVVSLNENEAKLDPQTPNPADRVSKMRNQQERQALAYILARQVIGILQRTKLHVTVLCQAWHAKNSRHLLLDIVDNAEPTMLIVGSRGLGQLKGIILGSTSHYLVQKCSVPVMVARRRLKRPPRRNAHLSPHRARVSLAEAAGVERVTAGVDRDVENMRDELDRDDDRREHEATEEIEEDADTEQDGEIQQIGEKVAGD